MGIPNACSSLLAWNCLVSRQNFGRSVIGNEMGNVAVVPKSKVGNGTCFPEPNSYARWPVGWGVESGVGGSSNLSVSILVFSRESLLGTTSLGSIVAVVPKSKVGNGTCFPEPNSYARWPVGWGVESGVGGSSKLSVSILVFSRESLLGTTSLDSSVPVPLMLDVSVMAIVCRGSAFVGVAGEQCSVLTSL